MSKFESLDIRFYYYFPCRFHLVHLARFLEVYCRFVTEGLPLKSVSVRCHMSDAFPYAHDPASKDSDYCFVNSYLTPDT